MLVQKLYLPLLQFLIHYRRTALGPLWLVVGPALFIFVLGGLFARVSNIETSVFIPHLTIGFIAWTLIAGFVNRSTTVFQRNKPQILQSGARLTDILFTDIASTSLQFLHQVILVIFVMIYFAIVPTVYAFVSLIGIALLIANGYWLGTVFGIIGSRYRDVSEVAAAAMRIAFLATPIIWMPGEGRRSALIEAYLTFNPFYHFIEVVRAPLLGKPIDPLSWAVVLGITAVGFLLANIFYKRYHKFVPLWV